MANKRVHKLEAHDTDGVESERIEWNESDDGYGSNIKYGDRSMQRMVERGGRTPWETTGDGEEGFGLAQTPEGFDKEPILNQYGKKKA